MKRLENFAPVGRNIKGDLTLYAIGLAIAGLLSLAYFGPLWVAYYEVTHGEALMMRPFVFVVGGWFLLFPMLAVICLGFIFVYYQMHFGTTKTMYTMRRLPDRWSLQRRCLALPIALAVLTMVIAAVLMGLYYLIYLAVTPAEYLVENQMGCLIDAWFHDVPEWAICYSRY